MQTLADFKQFLGPVAKGLTDAQLEQLRAEMYVLAQLLLDIYASKQSQTGAEREPLRLTAPAPNSKMKEKGRGPTSN